VDSIVTIWIPSRTSSRPSAVIAPLVALTSCTVLRLVPGRDGCGTRTHTVPLALATSTAATRS
jgi:hypothetical protein